MKYLLFALLFISSFAYTQDCSKYTKEYTDEVEGKSYTLADNIVVSSNEQEGLIIMFVKLEKALAMSITSVGSGKCVDKGSQVNILFTDGTRMNLLNEVSFNCESKTTIYFEENRIDDYYANELSTKKIKIMRVHKSSGFVEENFSEDQADLFMNTFKCLYK